MTSSIDEIKNGVYILVEVSIWNITPIFYSLLDLDRITEFDFLPNCVRVSMEHLQRVWHANRGCFLLWTPGPVHFGICMCSNVETNLSRTCLASGLSNIPRYFCFAQSWQGSLKHVLALIKARMYSEFTGGCITRYEYFQIRDFTPVGWHYYSN